MICTCGDGKHDTFNTTAWHRAYRAWYNHDRAGNKIRAALFGWIADRLCHYA